ncbi:cystathionine gamma-synthase [Protomyces lactucae-debilis]|uniref:cystathionine gamma-synthase n=1 Tax=Protomyces lactucae-debilis TaxID=2754530 RepID=A0A1Y2FIB0_PROLT|nr:cystathionine gamma-synthase [Protomyces lactucae-debilis]ORY83690.1 cystathionine gamma-synthase [Protomyces lactucae-debilis]
MPAIPTETGLPIPGNTPHAISVTLPTWAANVGYEEGADWVVSKMQCGYPRFFIAKNIAKLAERCVTRFGKPGEAAMLFPSMACAERCRLFILDKCSEAKVRVAELHDLSPALRHAGGSSLCVVLYEASLFPLAKQYWQHTGEGISSRQADYYLRQVDQAQPKDTVEFKKGGSNRHYSRQPSTDKSITRHSSSAAAGDAETLNRDQLTYLEERYGRNLNLQSVEQAKLAVRRRIAGSLTLTDSPEVALEAKEESPAHQRVGVDDVYLFPTGMTSIFHAHQLALSALPDGSQRKSACFGFPYTDTLKILEKWGPGAHFFGRGDAQDLVKLEAMLAGGERLLALFCECPSNPLLRTPPLKKLRELADQYGFLIVIDETIGNFINVRVCQYADIIVSSLTKVFSGDSNVMGGSFILSAKALFYKQLKDQLTKTYEDNLWVEDAVTLERNSRDFISRIERINQNAEALCELVLKQDIKALHYPKYGETSANYEAIKAPDGGYGGLLSITFDSVEEAAVFYDALHTCKGPSLGTNFTLSSPYTLLAHFTELPWAETWGVDQALVRVSVGLEPTGTLLETFETAFKALTAFKQSSVA